MSSDMGAHARRRVTVGEIAELADVRPSAVSNWRNRHSDFPLPVEKTAGGDLFDLQSVLTWFDAHGKAYRPPIAPRGQDLWTLLEDLRDSGLELDESTVLVMQLLYVRCCVGPAGPRDHVELAALWGRISDDANGARASWENAVGEISGANPLLARVLTLPPRLRNDQLARAVSFIAQLGAHAPDWGALATALLRRYEDVQGMRGASSLTPQSVTDLMVGLLEPITGTIYDPACGLAMVLADAWRRRVSEQVVVVGQEINEYNWRLGFLHLAAVGARFEMETGDTLRDDRFRSLRADRITADPPLGQRVDIATGFPDERWGYGTPKSSTEWSWAQHMAFHLREGGAGVMTITPSALFGREWNIRSEMLRAGLVDAVVELPPGLFAGTSIPVALLVLARGRPNRHGKVLFIDARQLGKSRRGKPHILEQADIHRIEAALASWRAGTFEEVPFFAASASVQQILSNRGDLSPQRYVRYAAQVTEVEREAVEERLFRTITDVKGGLPHMHYVVDQIGKDLDARSLGPFVDWPLVKLGDLLVDEPLTGTRHDPEGEGPVVPYIRTGLVSGGNGRLTDVPHEVTRARTRGRVAKRGDLLLVARGLDVSTGGCAIVLFDGEAAYAESLMRLSPDPARVDPDYLRYYLTSHQGRTALAAATSGSVIANLRPKALTEVEIRLPDLATQRLIATAITRVEGGMSELQAMLQSCNAMLEAMRDGVAAGLFHPRSDDSTRGLE